MKKCTREGVGLAEKKGEKETISHKEENNFGLRDNQVGVRLKVGLIPCTTITGSCMFGLRHGGHRNITANYFKVIKFEANVSKAFHGGLCDLKYVPRKVRHVCHMDGEKDERFLVEH